MDLHGLLGSRFHFNQLTFCIMSCLENYFERQDHALDLPESWSLSLPRFLFCHRPVKDAGWRLCLSSPRKEVSSLLRRMHSFRGIDTDAEVRSRWMAPLKQLRDEEVTSAMLLRECTTGDSHTANLIATIICEATVSRHLFPRVDVHNSSG